MKGLLFGPLKVKVKLAVVPAQIVVGETTIVPSPSFAFASVNCVVATKPGDFRKTLQIRTDQQDAPLTVTVEGNVVP